MTLLDFLGSLLIGLEGYVPGHHSLAGSVPVWNMEADSLLLCWRSLMVSY